MSFMTLGISQLAFRCSTECFWLTGRFGERCSGIWRGWFCSLGIGFVSSWWSWGWQGRSVNIGAGLVCRNRLHINNVNRDRPAKNSLGSVRVLGLGWFGWGKNLLDSAVEFWQSLGFQFSAKVAFGPFFCFQFCLGAVSCRKVPCFWATT